MAITYFISSGSMSPIEIEVFCSNVRDEMIRIVQNGGDIRIERRSPQFGYRGNRLIMENIEILIKVQVPVIGENKQ